jgi:hypothetical protein
LVGNGPWKGFCHREHLTLSLKEQEKSQSC